MRGGRGGGLPLSLNAEVETSQVTSCRGNEIKEQFVMDMTGQRIQVDDRPCEHYLKTPKTGNW